MFARSTTIDAQPESIDAGIAHVRDEVMPALSQMDGYVGLSLLVDRQSGEVIATSAWETEEALRSSTERTARVRQRASEMFGGGAATKVDEWNIAVLHRAHAANPGAYARATWIKVVPDQAARSVDYYRASVLPEMEQLEGFCSASLMVDLSAHRAVASATFDSLDAMERNRDRATALRTATLRELGAEALDVGEYELAIAALRVPELT